MEKLTDLPNIGPIVAAKLQAVGIETPETLRQMGSKEAFLRIRQSVDPGACLSMLSGLEGAIQGIRWHDLPTEDRQDLKAFFNALP